MLLLSSLLFIDSIKSREKGNKGAERLLGKFQALVNR